MDTKPNQAGTIYTVVILIILIITGGGLWYFSRPYQFREPPKEDLSTWEDASRLSNIKQLEQALNIYHQQNGSKFPNSLEELLIPPADVYSSSLKEVINSRIYLYARSTDRSKYHIGVMLNDVKKDYTSKYLNADKDFNSLITGYVGGFDGNDPVYDLGN